MTIPSYNINAFQIQPVLGDLDQQGNAGSVTNAAADAAVVTALLPGQPVKLVDSAGGVPKVVALAANTDETFGVIVRNVKDASYAAGEFMELAGRNSIIWQVSNAAIARGAKLEYVYNANSGNGAVITNAGTNPVIGRAVDKATASGQLIRILLDVPLQ